MELPDSIQIHDVDARRAFEEGYRLQMDGDLEGAIDAYRESLHFDETAEAHTFLGWAYSHQDKLDRAIEECHQAIQIDPDFGNPYNDIGVYELQKGNLKEAMSWFDDALRAPRYDSYCFPQFNLGRCHMYRGHFERAAHHFKEALKERPDFEKARDALRQIKNRLN